MAYKTVILKGGRTRKMQERYAKILVGMGRAEYVTDTPAPEPEPTPVPFTPPVPEPTARAVSRPAAELAEQYGVDLTEVTGTGANGMITKPDVERLIQE